MASKKVSAVIKLQCPAGAATPAPPIGPALGPHGVSAPKFVQEFNDRTKNMEKGFIAIATNKLMEQVRDGNLGAICFFLKCRGAWSEKLKIESNNTNTTRIFLFDGSEAQDAPKDA